MQSLHLTKQMKNGEVIKEAAFTFRQGTEITKGRVKTGYVEETNPEWFKSIDVSNTAIAFVSGNRVDWKAIVDTLLYNVTERKELRLQTVTLCYKELML